MPFVQIRRAAAAMRSLLWVDEILSSQVRSSRDLAFRIFDEIGLVEPINRCVLNTVRRKSQHTTQPLGLRFWDGKPPWHAFVPWPILCTIKGRLRPVVIVSNVDHPKRWPITHLFSSPGYPNQSKQMEEWGRRRRYRRASSWKGLKFGRQQTDDPPLSFSPRDSLHCEFLVSKG